LLTIEQLQAIPDVNFVDTDVNTMLQEAINTYEQTYYHQTGIAKTLAPGDPIRILLYCQCLREYIRLQNIDNAAKQNLLKYAMDDYLINKGADLGVSPPAAQSATTMLQFVLSEAQPIIVPIPAGTRATTSDNVFFATTEYAEIPAGQTSVTVQACCDQAGTIGNDYVPGQINTLVDPIPYIASVSNVDTSQGGNNGFVIGDALSNDNLREQIFLKPESFSVAGPTGAYIYFVKNYDRTILDVAVLSLLPNEVDIFFIIGIYDEQNNLVGISLPEASMISGVQDYLTPDNTRPLNDRVVVGAPVKVNYNVSLTYYINSNDLGNVTGIQTAVNNAVSTYNLWQQSKIGRDINPDELQALVKQAGAKRVVITSPTFTVLNNAQVASLGTVTVTYGGLENE
jgi:phage-related baseplate assembly protein